MVSMASVDICGSSASSSSQSDGSESEGNGSKRYRNCDLCSYTTDRKNNLARHIRSMHSKLDSQVFECCSISFANKCELRAHKKVVHETGYMCKQCPHSFTRQALLKRHMSVHTGIKAYHCSDCEYDSSHKSNLGRHCMLVHKKEKVCTPYVKKRNGKSKKQPVALEIVPRADFPCELASYNSQDHRSSTEQLDSPMEQPQCPFDTNKPDETTLNAAMVLAQLCHLPTFYDSAFAPKQEVAEFVEINENITAA